jgi:predicted outer membrane lipoprotein
MAFSNPIVGGGGNLIRTEIQSPNFDEALLTGWAIYKNGQAYFYQLTGAQLVTNYLQLPFTAFLAPSGDTSGASDYAAITTLLSDGYRVLLTGGVYYINDTISTTQFKPGGCLVSLVGSGSCTIEQVTSNIPIIQASGGQQHLKGLTLKYSVQQTSDQTSAIALELGDDTNGSCFESEFEDLYIQLANTAIALNPSVSTVAGVFSCSLTDIHILGYSVSAISIIGNNGLGGANCTGCVVSNVYVHNNFTGTDANSTSWPVRFENFDELIINQMNIEHAEVFDSDALLISAANATINALHFEHLELGGTDEGLISVHGSSTVNINSMSSRFCTFTGSDSSSFVRFQTAGSTCQIHGLWFPNDDNTVTAPDFVLCDFGSADNCTLYMDGLDVYETLLTSDYINVSGTSVGTIYRPANSGIATPTPDVAASVTNPFTQPMTVCITGDADDGFNVGLNGTDVFETVPAGGMVTIRTPGLGTIQLGYTAGHPPTWRWIGD